MLLTALVVTAIAIVGGLGWLPSESGPAATRSLHQAVADSAAPDETTQATPRAARAPTPTPMQDDDSATIAAASDSTVLPPRSGTGRRVVYSQARQRVWLVEAGSKVVRTYLVSGSVYKNLKAGTYAVYSRSRHAIGIDDSGTMEYFVRFTQGTDEGAAIGFHTIPVDDGRPLQTRAQLGTPRSHGCIRQERSNAIALWDFAPVDTKVVVTA
ncbi:MAG: L,D-transpeptidase [Nocardioidaceae bacterium]|nr:L,D-transpeptidase [Nocardioidaceae bacterium]